MRCCASCQSFLLCFRNFFYLHQSGGWSICGIDNSAVIQRTVACGRCGDIKFLVVVMIKFTLCIHYFVFTPEFRRLLHIFWSSQIYIIWTWWFNGLRLLLILLLTLLFTSIRTAESVCVRRYLYQNRTNLKKKTLSIVRMKNFEQFF